MYIRIDMNVIRTVSVNDDRKKQQRDINILLIEKHSLTDELAAIMEKSKQIQIRYKVSLLSAIINRCDKE